MNRRITGFVLTVTALCVVLMSTVAWGQPIPPTPEGVAHYEAGRSTSLPYGAKLIFNHLIFLTRP